MTDEFLLSSTSPVAWQQLTAHPLAEMFPLMVEAELAELTADIEENGLQEAIDLYEGQILDGRNRFAACLRCGVEPRFVEYPGDDPLRFIISKNLHRRHLSQAAKGEVVTKILTAYPELSNRAIGRMARVDGKTVAARRAELEASAEIPHFDTRKDSKGHSRPAHKAPPSAAADKLAAEVMEDLAAGLDAADDALPADFGEPLAVIPKPSPGLAREDKAVIAFFCVLHESEELYRHLHNFVQMLGDEDQRIAALPQWQREALARDFLARLHVTADDLPPVADVPAFQGSIH
jgi:ParB-like chromosome segregation protein Spo0J